VRQHAIDDTPTTSVGVGDIRLAIAHARGFTASDVERGVHDALERGITLVEPGDVDTERMCGDAVRSLRLRDRAIVATHLAALDPRPGPPRDLLGELLPPAYVRERIEASLRATKLDVLPLAFLPLRPPWLASRAWPELAGTCARLVREGKVLRWGARLELDTDRFDDDLAAIAPVREPFVALTIPFSACDRRALPLLAGPLPVLARAPLAGGALAGALGPGMKLALRDDRDAIDAATLERIAVGLARLAPLVRDVPPPARSCDAARAVLEGATRRPDIEASTVADLALRYVLDRGAIAMPRLHRREHVIDAIAAGSAAPLSATTFAAIEAALP